MYKNNKYFFKLITNDDKKNKYLFLIYFIKKNHYNIFNKKIGGPYREAIS